MSSIAIGSDAAGFGLKSAVISYLRGSGIAVTDFGTNASEPMVDYPDYAAPVCESIVTGAADLGILICGTGIGMSIVANKVSGIRASLVHDTFGAQLSRKHNNANVLVMGAWDVTPERAESIVDRWLSSSYAGGRHERRLEAIREVERTTESRLVPDISKRTEQ